MDTEADKQDKINIAKEVLTKPVNELYKDRVNSGEWEAEDTEEL
jgi:hypothetical protein